jgi:hypothetical protein
MSTTTDRESAPRDRGSVDDRLARLLETTAFARLVPHLAPETLHQLVRHRGLEACGELVTSATPAQLTALLDLDLWRLDQPGRDEQFDVERFGEWLEVLVEAGESAAARTVAALDPHLIVTGLSRYLRPFDPGTFEPTASTDDEPADRHDLMHSETSPNVLECEVGGYLVRARRADAWDAIVTLLVTLESEHDEFFHVVMQGCRRLSHSRPEVDGLDGLLMAPEQHRHDAAIERERRRSRHGYATPGDARAFLQMARRPRKPARGAKTLASIAPNPVATAYFRAAEEGAAVSEMTAPEVATAPAPDGRGGDDLPSSIDAVLDLLVEAGVMPARPRALLDTGDEAAGPAAVPTLKRLMATVRHHDETAYLTRSRELAFLANTLLAGCAVQSRPFTPREASDAAAGICNLGLESGPATPDAFLIDHDLVTMFELGWSVLYRDVSLFVADQLVTSLADVRDVDADTRRGLLMLRRRLQTARKAGAPWTARAAADVLATLDMTACISVVGLLDECPILPAALTAVLEHRTTAVSPTAFAFISTTAQIDAVRRFMSALPGLLSR